MSQLRAYILCRFADQSGLYADWVDDAGIPTEIIDEYLPDWQVPDDAGILITHMHYRWEELTTLRAIMKRGQVPILILSDGILEYRNTWEHPDLVDGSLFQPLFGHKLACIGKAQARVIESWGNAGRCEVVGLPRFDSVNDSSITAINQDGPFRILVATANTPAFDQSQRNTVSRSLRDLKGWIDQNPRIGNRPIEMTWRLSDGLGIDLGVGEDLDPETRPPISDAINQVDAVITTPSTLVLESMIRNRPTAILDFHSCPQYIDAPWTISAPDHFDAVVTELANAPAHKMMYQRFVLQDQLEFRSPAKPRMLKLIQEMVNAGNVARAQREPLVLPARILSDPQHEIRQKPDGFDLASLYPKNEVFQIQELARLQIELSAAIQRLDQLPFELADKNQTIAQLMRTLDRSRDRVEEMHNRVVAIRKRFGVQPTRLEGEPE